MSDDIKKPSGGDQLKPKLGVKAAPLPSIGSKPSVAPAKLPGLKVQKAAAALPGLSAGQKPAAVPPFMQKQAPAQPVIDKRDPFGGWSTAGKAEQMAQMPYTDESVILGTTATSAILTDEQIRKDRIRSLTKFLAIFVAALLVGYVVSAILSSGTEKNLTVRDAKIVDFEIKKAAKIFGETQEVINAALAKASQNREYTVEHLEFLKKNITGNPIEPTIFTDRNFQSFDAAMMQNLVEYNTKWNKFYNLTKRHWRQTDNDRKMLTTPNAAAKKAEEADFGAIFTRDSSQDYKLFADLVILGRCEPNKERITMCSVQAETGSYADERQLYNPKEGDAALAQDPDQFVAEVGAKSKSGVLKNASKSHFSKYVARLKEMADLMNEMSENQKILLEKLGAASSQGTAMISRVNVNDQLAKYMQKKKVSAVETSAE